MSFNRINSILFLLLYNNIFYSFTNINGDPFDFIKSTIKFIESKSDYDSIIGKPNKIIIFFSYNNNFYGNDYKTFSEIAQLYSEIAGSFSQNKLIEFYRINMLTGIASDLIASESPAMLIFYNGHIIDSLAGIATKNQLVNLIVKNINQYLKN